MKVQLILFFSCIAFSVHAQVVTQISTVWDDRVDEWIIYTDMEDMEGIIELKWPLKSDLSEWRYELDDLDGTIQQTWKGNPNSWEIIPSSGQRIVAKTVWKNDFTEWKVVCGKKTYRLKSKYKSQLFEWGFKNSSEEEFLVYMLDEGDPRDWGVEDYIEEGSLDLTICLSFLAIFNSLPRG